MLGWGRGCILEVCKWLFLLRGPGQSIRIRLEQGFCRHRFFSKNPSLLESPHCTVPSQLELKARIGGGGMLSVTSEV